MYIADWSPEIPSRRQSPLLSAIPLGITAAGKLWPYLLRLVGRGRASAVEGDIPAPLIE